MTAKIRTEEELATEQDDDRTVAELGELSKKEQMVYLLQHVQMLLHLIPEANDMDHYPACIRETRHFKTAMECEAIRGLFSERCSEGLIKRLDKAFVLLQNEGFRQKVMMMDTLKKQLEAVSAEISADAGPLRDLHSALKTIDPQVTEMVAKAMKTDAPTSTPPN